MVTRHVLWRRRKFCEHKTCLASTIHVLWSQGMPCDCKTCVVIARHVCVPITRHVSWSYGMFCIYKTPFGDNLDMLWTPLTTHWTSFGYNVDIIYLCFEYDCGGWACQLGQIAFSVRSFCNSDLNVKRLNLRQILHRFPQTPRVRYQALVFFSDLRMQSNMRATTALHIHLAAW